MFLRFGLSHEQGGAVGTADVAPVPAAPATPAVVRDDSGRFAKAKIEQAASGFQSEDAQAQPVAAAPAIPATPAAPVVPAIAAEPVAAADPLAAIDAFLQSTATAEPAATPAAPVAPATPAAPDPVEVLQVKQWLNNREVAAEAVKAVQAHEFLNSALNRGDIEGALKAFAPQAIEAIEEFIYQKNKDRYAQRYTDEANGVKADPRVATLERQLAAVTQFIQNGQQHATQSQQQQVQQQTLEQVAGKYQTFVDGLYGSAGLKDSPNRAWLEGRVNLELGRDPQLKPLTDAALRGDPKALQLLIGKTGAKFREVYTQFKPLLTAAVQPPAPAGQPAGATALMAAAGTSTQTQGPANDLVSESGGINGKGIVRRLRAMVS